MVLGGLVILSVILLVAGAGLLTSGADDVTQGGVTFFTFFFMLPAIGVGVVSFLAGLAGLHSDPDKCRKHSKILVVLAVLSAFSAIKSGTFNIMTLLETAVYAVHCYLAHTQYY